MDLVLKGRGVRITEPMRGRIEHKLAKLGRLEPRVHRLEVEVIGQRNPRVDHHTVEVAAETARKVFRARGSGDDVETALDQVLERLGKQITSHRGRIRDRRQSGPGTAPSSRNQGR